jgi:peptidoglycan/LPS O-acetylase OafA/YrhL
MGPLPTDPDRIDVLDGWRGVSVALVIISHVFLRQGVSLPEPYVSAIIAVGYVGVDVFFVISGFVICRSFIKEINKFHRITASAFYVRRAF